MTFETIIFQVEKGIATITINRPKALNALNAAVLDDLNQALNLIEEDDSIGVVILTGAGEKAFVAGADISQMQSMNAMDAMSFAKKGQSIFLRIESINKPFIAAVDGFALGGGCELSMSCDIRLATQKSKFGQPESGLGVIPGFGGTQRLPRLIGRAKAMELLFTCDSISAEEAKTLGLVNHVVEDKAALLSMANAMAEKILTKGGIAVGLCKQAVRDGLELELGKANAYEAALFASCFDTMDQKEGMGAFLEKRKAAFQGR